MGRSKPMVGECIGKYDPQSAKCTAGWPDYCTYEKECMAKTYEGSPWCKRETTISLFDINDAEIHRIFAQIRAIPTGIHHSWYIENPNGDRSHCWSSVSIFVKRPTYLSVILESRRLKVPGDNICGTMECKRQFRNLTKAEKYLRRKIRMLQRKWANNWVEGKNHVLLNDLERMWRFS